MYLRIWRSMNVSHRISTEELLHRSGIRFQGGICDYSSGKPWVEEREYSIVLDPSAGNSLELKEEGVIISGDIRTTEGNDQITVDLTMSVAPGTHARASLFFSMDFPGWEENTYVLLPGAAYNGNRFESRRIPYSPKLKDPADIGANVGPIISDIPRLNIQPGPSRMHIPAGALALPAAGFWFPESEVAYLVTFDPISALGVRGIILEEDGGKGTGKLVIQSPVVRTPFRYRICDTRFPSEDEPADLSTGHEEHLSIGITVFPARSVQELFDRLFLERTTICGEYNSRPVYPFSEVFRQIEEKYNRDNWVEGHGYYSVGMRENFLQDWQIGWTGGMIATLPLLALGTDRSVERVLSNFDWLFRSGISPSGFFWDSGEMGTRWYGGDIRNPHTTNWHLVRKSGDGLYYILRQFVLMEKKGIRVESGWSSAAQGVADAFCRLWKKYGQLGQFIHNHTGEIIVGGSTSGAIVPASLALAAEYFGNPDYRATAVEMGAYFYDRFVTRGLSTGGPGDALQCPDSESAYGLLESFVRLFEGTGESKWLDRAGAMARQFSSWVYGLDFPFPPGTVSGDLGNTTRGAVMANVQNTHPSPGICTYSGLALFRLALYSGNEGYARLLQEITRQIAQNLSHPDRPIPGLRNGWISERINTSDWLEGVGAIMEGSTWSEVSAMLTCAEIPSVCLDKKTGSLWVFDHLDVSAEGEMSCGGEMTLRIRNPTPYPAVVRICIAGQVFAGPIIPEHFLLDIPTHSIEPGRSLLIHC
jgi:hypothetical protein